MRGKIKRTKRESLGKPPRVSKRGIVDEGHPEKVVNEAAIIAQAQRGLSMKAMAAMSGLSKSQFYRRFKSLVDENRGKAAVDHLEKIRIIADNGRLDPKDQIGARKFLLNRLDPMATIPGIDEDDSDESGESRTWEITMRKYIAIK